MTEITQPINQLHRREGSQNKQKLKQNFKMSQAKNQNENEKKKKKQNTKEISVL